MRYGRQQWQAAPDAGSIPGPHWINESVLESSGNSALGLSRHVKSHGFGPEKSPAKTYTKLDNFTIHFNYIYLADIV